jgi:Arc/MetJ-type ribon-helix-helix transcriptional regulator
MRPLLIQLDEQTLTALNRVAAPGKRQRSEFVRQAIRKAIRQADYRAMREAYRKEPDSMLEADDCHCRGLQTVKQFEIWWANLPAPAGRRPVLLTRNDAYQYLSKVHRCGDHDDGPVSAPRRDSRSIPGQAHYRCRGIGR